MYLGHLAIYKKGEKKVACIVCEGEIEPGRAYLLLRKKIRHRNGKTLWWLNQGLHIYCMAVWITETALPVFLERGDRRSGNGGKPGRRVALKSDITPEEVILRRKLILKRNYKIWELRHNENKREKLAPEINDLLEQIKQLGEYKPKHKEARESNVRR